jgi:hypothetical protein
MFPANWTHLFALYGSQNKQRLFPYTALTDWFFIAEKECVYCAVRTKTLKRKVAQKSLETRCLRTGRPYISSYFLPKL